MRKRIIVHPLLVAILPILFLYRHNIRELYLGELAVPLLLVGLSSLLLWALLRLLLRDGVRAALLSSLFWLWLFFFGHLRGLVEPSGVPSFESGRSCIFVGLYATALLVGAGFIIARGRGARSLSSLLNIAVVALVAWNVVAIGSYEGRRALVSRRFRRAREVSQVDPKRAGVRPNIYYIILDSYGRADVLRDIYHYDNSEFLDHLRRKGFLVPPRARSNYGWTSLSLACSLNMHYLDELAAQVGANSGDFRPLANMIQRNRLFDFLRRRGYRIVAFPSEYSLVHIETADVYIKGMSGLSEFQGAIVDATPLPLIYAARRRDPAELPHAQKILYAFDHLPDTAKLEPPIFVFAHILCPHSPFVFDAQGRVIWYGLVTRLVMADVPARSRADTVTRYANQARFVSRKTAATVDEIIKRANRPTVIIVQADHGPWAGLCWWSAEQTDVRERFGILMACRLPDGGAARLPDDFSPVNVFRVVLSRYFGADLPLLSNESYFSPNNRPYRFVRVTDRVNASAPKAARPAAAR